MNSSTRVVEMRFRDRVDAGQRLADQLKDLRSAEPVVLALPRGGVPIGVEVARVLQAPLEVFVARKIGAPQHPEFGIGAIAEGDVVVADRSATKLLGLTDEQFDQLAAEERRELQRRVQHYRGDRTLPDLNDRTVILVDDGLATGVTAEAALTTLRARHPRRLLLAAPACARETATRLGAIADEVRCVLSPSDFYAVGQWYVEFGQITDEEVLDLLAAAHRGT